MKTQLFVCFIFLIGLSACEDFLKIDPPKHELSTPTVFTSDAIAEAAMRGVYSELTTSFFANGLGSSITALGDHMADQLYSTSALYDPYSDNMILPDHQFIGQNWSGLYEIIYQANSVLEGLAASTLISAAKMEQLEGEARFIRAFCYFYLVNLWGDVPLVLTTDYRVNSSIARASLDLIYDQIETDLVRARQLLGDDYSISGGGRTRANRSVATALLARMYLYREQWAMAEAEATKVIEHAAYTLVSLDQVFLKNNTEAIWQFYPTQNLPFNTREAILFLPPNASLPPSVLLTPELKKSFEVGDARMVKWVFDAVRSGTTYTHVNKYKVYIGGTTYTEYSVVLRLAEQYLIRAEARAHQEKLTEATSDLNIIRARAGLAATLATTRSEILDAIIQERRVEFFGEWGHRWFDLVRTDRASSVLGTLKPDWQEEDSVWPVPLRELQANPNMTQNPGY